MMTDAWSAAFGEMLDEQGLRYDNAKSLVRFVKRHATGVATFIEARSDGERELVVLDFRTGKPQRPVYPILSVERIGIVFASAESLPFVHMLRDDFPDTEHQQLVPEGCAKAICVDDRVWPEARLSWTPAELIQRTLSWFQRAARGELHDARQPIDPVLFGSPLSFVIHRSILQDGTSEDLVAEHNPKIRSVLRVKRMKDLARPTSNMEPLCIAAYRVQPEKMKRLQFAPQTLAGLSLMLAERGLVLRDDLSARFKAWIGEGTAATWRLNARFVVILEMPIVSPNGEQQVGTDLRAFITAQSAGDIAVALGTAIKSDKSDEGSTVGYVLPFGNQPVIDEDALGRIDVQSAEVNLELDRVLATKLSGRMNSDSRKAVLVGAGAIGSHIADCLVREGRFEWTIIDDDHLLPHNLARHIAHKERTTEYKAETLAGYLNAILAEPAIAIPISSNLLATDAAREKLDTALKGADVILDASASVVVERFVSDHEAKARRASAFFNPVGDAVVLLAEPADRSVVLRDLEAQYLRQLVHSDDLAGHLAKPPQTVAYTGACRAITNVIPQSQVCALSGIAASGLSRAMDADDGAILIWSLGANGAVACHSAKPEEVWGYKAREWTIAIDAGLVARMRSMREHKLPCETGGIVCGLVDIPAKSIHLVDAFPAPPDSIEARDSFVRGVQGVEECIEEVRRRTDGQLRYVGEWHSHPPRSSARPSTTDAIQLDWLAALMDMDSLPGLMVIAADRELSVIYANQEAERTGGDK